jgi:hypothetical protein
VQSTQAPWYEYATRVPSFGLNIDSNIPLRMNGRTSELTVVARCEEGQNLHVEVKVVQGGMVGSGVGQGRCTGMLARYPVSVSGQGRTFVEGPAVATASAIIRELGQVVVEESWTRKVELVEDGGL